MSIKEKSKISKTTLLLCFAIFCSVFSVKAQDAVEEKDAEEKSAVALYNEGLAALKAKDYTLGLSSMEAALEKAAVDENEKVISLAKKNGAVAAYYVGNGFLKSEKLDSARIAFEKGITINDGYASNHLGIARVLDKEKASGEAMEAYVKYAMLSAEAGKADRAADAYKRAKNMLVKLYIAKDFEQVTKIGDVFLANTDNEDVAYYVGKSYMEAKNFESAVTNLEKSIASSEEVDDKVNYALGTSYEALGKKSEAIAAYKKVTDAKYKAQAEYRVGKLSE